MGQSTWASAKNSSSSTPRRHVGATVFPPLDPALLRRKVIWLDIHARSKHMFPDEKPEKVKKFHEEMPGYLRNSCGIDNVASVFDMTEALVGSDLRNESRSMTHDEVQWLLEVNLYKAYAIANEILKMELKAGG